MTGLNRDRLRWPALRAQCVDIVPVLARTYVPVLAVLVGLFLLWLLAGIDTAALTRDALSVVETELLEIQRDPDPSIYDLAHLHIPVYAGAVSHVGVLLWAAAAAIACFTYAGTRGRADAPYGPEFFRSAAAVTIVLLLDDLFLIHERVLPVYAGVDERITFAGYGLLLIAYLGLYARSILDSDFLLLAAALACFAVSLAVDFIPDALAWSIPQVHFFEDGAKLAGIAGWLGYQAHTAAQQWRSLAPQRG